MSEIPLSSKAIGEVSYNPNARLLLMMVSRTSSADGSMNGIDSRICVPSLMVEFLVYGSGSGAYSFRTTEGLFKSLRVKLTGGDFGTTVTLSFPVEFLMVAAVVSEIDDAAMSSPRVMMRFFMLIYFFK